MDPEKIAPFLQGIIDLEKKELTDDQGVKSVIEGFTYKELLSYLKDTEPAEVVSIFQSILFAHLSAGTAKLALQGGIGEGCEVHAQIKDLRELIQLIRETSELIYFLDTK
jgi:hypothetical protein